MIGLSSEPSEKNIKLFMVSNTWNTNPSVWCFETETRAEIVTVQKENARKNALHYLEHKLHLFFEFISILSFVSSIIFE